MAESGGPRCDDPACDGGGDWGRCVCLRIETGTVPLARELGGAADGTEDDEGLNCDAAFAVCSAP